MTLMTRLTSMTAALALAVGLFASSAAPARASDDMAKLLFGATALAIIAGAVHADNKRRVAPRHHYDPQPRRHYRAAVLPHNCKITVQAGHRTQQAYRGRCLQRAGLHNLPGQCVVGQWKGAVYGARCLGQFGYVRG